MADIMERGVWAYAQKIEETRPFKVVVDKEGKLIEIIKDEL